MPLLVLDGGHDRSFEKLSISMHFDHLFQTCFTAQGEERAAGHVDGAVL